MYPQHRIAIEPRGPGIWLLFYETLESSWNGIYKQQLLYIRKTQKFAESDAEAERYIRHIEPDVVIRDDSQRNVMSRQA